MLEMKDRIKMLEGALHEIFALMQEVDYLLKGTSHETHYNAYGKYGFKNLIGEGNPNDTSLPDVIEDMKYESDLEDSERNEVLAQKVKDGLDALNSKARHPGNHCEAS